MNLNIIKLLSLIVISMLDVIQNLYQLLLHPPAVQLRFNSIHAD